jgi:hypothetical protein
MASTISSEQTDGTINMLFFREFWQYMKSRKKLWMLPIVIVFLLIGGLLVLAQGSVIAPFIYSLF